MSSHKETSALIDNIVRIVAGSAFIGVGLTAPQMLLMLDKPVNKLFDKLDDREKIRKINMSIKYMRRSGLLTGDYEHGFEITKSSVKRLEKLEFNNLQIKKPAVWDNGWRLVLFDIPETNRDGRIALTRKIKMLGFQPLQQSVWIYPFPCKDIIQKICLEYGVNKWVTYLKTNHIDQQEKLLIRFQEII